MEREAFEKHDVTATLNQHYITTKVDLAAMLTKCAIKIAATSSFSNDSRSIILFQAQDGIRDVAVTGVQTCALPSSRVVRERRRRGDFERAFRQHQSGPRGAAGCGQGRSEERRVGKESRSGTRPDHDDKRWNARHSRNTTSRRL